MRWSTLILSAVMALQTQHQAVPAKPSANQQSAITAATQGPVRQQLRVEEYKPRCNKPRNREESELCAQWGAVAAARDANRLTVDANRALADANAVSATMLAWTKAGFVALILTLVATAWAAW